MSDPPGGCGSVFSRTSWTLLLGFLFLKREEDVSGALSLEEFVTKIQKMSTSQMEANILPS